MLFLLIAQNQHPCETSFLPSSLAMAGDFHIEDGDDILCEPCDEEGDDLDPLMCVVCGQFKQMKNQVYCSEVCAKDVRACERDAKRQGTESAKCFKSLKTRGGPAFANMINYYKAKCISAGRGYKRPAFDHVSYHIAFTNATRVRRGQKHVWVDNETWKNIKKNRNGWTDQRAEQEWILELERLPPEKVRNEKTEVLFLMEDFIITEEMNEQSESMTLGLKPVKNPSQGAIDEMASYMGEDHKSFAELGRAMGLGDLLRNASRGQFQKSSAPNQDVQMAAQKAEAEAKAKAKPVAKRRKVFDAGGVRTKLEPEFEKWGTALETRIVKTIKDAEHTITEVKTLDLATKFAAAVSTLQTRLDYLKAATKTEAGGADEWTTFLESKTEEIRARPTEPIAEVAKIPALKTVTQGLANFTISAEEDVKTERVRLKELCAQLGSLVTRVVEQKARLAGLLSNHTKDEENC